jgi:hypothetical protein
MLLVAGCGGGGGTATAPSVSKADFAVQANAICQVMNDRIKAIPRPGAGPNAVADALDQSGEVVADTLAKLRALPMPAGDDGELGSIYSTIDVLLADLARYTTALRAGDPSAGSLSATVKADQTAANDVSNAYGLTVCGSETDTKGSDRTTSTPSGDLSSVRDAIASQMAPRTSPAAGSCVADKVTAQLTVQDLAAISITASGIDSSKLVTLSLNLQPATIAFWDAVFECMPAQISTLYSGGERTVVSCIEETIAQDKYLRLVFVVGTKTGSDPSPLYNKLGAKLDAALAACRAPSR